MMTSKIIEQVPFFQLVSDVDDKWMILRERYQNSRQLSGQVNLRTPMEIETDRAGKEPVNISEFIMIMMVEFPCNQYLES